MANDGKTKRDNEAQSERFIKESKALGLADVPEALEKAMNAVQMSSARKLPKKRPPIASEAPKE